MQMPHTLNGLSAIYIKLKQFDKAEKYSLKAYEISKKLDVLEMVKRSSMKLKELYLEKEDYENAYKYYEIIDQIDDSLFSIDNKRIINDMKEKYESEKKELIIENQKIEIEKKRQNQKNNVF